MPFPLGHTAIGLAVCKTAAPADTSPLKWTLPVFIAVLSNLPDLDILAGLLLQDNGNLFHRGPTHSLLFALLTGYLAGQTWRLGVHIPRLRFSLCFMIVFSHVLADMAFTSSPVSLFWPFEVHWSGGNSGWGHVWHAIVFDSIQDLGIVAVALSYIGMLGMLRKWLPDNCVPALVRRRMR
jgi:membrane-bound metal-dependent hydrolase YbcI (DUF457 family)